MKHCVPYLAMPTFLFIKGGEVVDRLMGANSDRLKEVCSFMRSCMRYHSQLILFPCFFPQYFSSLKSGVSNITHLAWFGGHGGQLHYWDSILN